MNVTLRLGWFFDSSRIMAISGASLRVDRFAVQLLFVIGIMPVCCVGNANDAVSYEQSIVKIRKVLPDGWRVAKIDVDVLPKGHYWGLKYEGKKGTEVVLQGPHDVPFYWEDSHGVWHQEPLAKEALFLYLMPPDYDQSRKRFFVMKSPPPAKFLLETKMLKIYGYTDVWTVDGQRVGEITDVARSGAKSFGFRGPSRYDSGVLSWTTWKKDIDAALRED
jgi:hypothetical protein